MEQSPDLSIIIVNYKSAGLVINCLQSIYANTQKISFEITVVDNHSGDASRQSVLAAYPSVRWIDMELQMPGLPALIMKGYARQEQT